jgi:CheY-like chemotaxis protein
MRVGAGQSSYILVSDRNPHVRDYLRRELIQEGYHVYEAKDGQEVLQLLMSGRPLDLLVLDPEMPYFSAIEIASRLKARHAFVPIVVHAFDIEDMNRTLVGLADAVVEKQGDNIDSFKQIIAELLNLRQSRSSTPEADGTGWA